MEKLLNKKEVAAVLGVTVKAIDKWLMEKSIPVIRLSRKCVRFSPSDLETYIRKHTEKPTSGKPLTMPREHDRHR